MAQPRFFRLLTIFAAAAAAVLLFCSSPVTARADDPRVSAAYTAWDDYFFYAAFQVNDHNVISTNRTPISQPQEDDDVEVFLNTNPSQTSSVRTADTYQMAVSAGSGCYFSVGDGAKAPKAKLVLTYKYAVTIDGTLNDPSDNDTGFTVELAIPWHELGLSGPPADGQTFGFNVISRNRESMNAPAASFVSLSPAVLSSADIQNPSKWTKIQFIGTLANQISTASHVFCPHILSDSSYPTIDGVVKSGEWDTKFGYSFGQTLIAGNAPAQDEEPNITESPFATLVQPVVQTPQQPDEPTSPTAPTTSTGPDYTISLPGGGEIHVGKLKPPPPPPVQPETVNVGGHHKIEKYPGSNTDPLAPNLPPDLQAEEAIGPEISPSASLSLVAQKDASPLVIAPYVLAYPASPLDLLDQPIDGWGPEFGGDHSQWHRDQMADARRAGIDVILPIINAGDPQSTRALAALVEALKEMKRAGEDYPLLGVKVSGNDALAAFRLFLEVVPQEFRAEVVLPQTDLNQRAYILYANTLPDVDALKDLAATESNSSDTVLVTTGEATSYLKIGTVSPGGLKPDGSIVGRMDTKTLGASWQKVYEGSDNWVNINSWNDYTNGTEIAASRQYGEQYADFNRASGLRWSGADQWDAKYLQNDVPSIIAQKTIYTVTVRVENNGSLPWRAGEGYALCYRWYKDGRLYDDSAPRLPLTDDVYPGECANLSVGVLAQNSFGNDIDPGRYTLVFDMVQGKDRWFSYVGSRPLTVPVRIEDKVDAPQALATVLSSTTPAIMDTDGAYGVTLAIRNEGQEVWTPTNTSLTLSGAKGDVHGTFGTTVYPGAIGHISVAVRVPDNSPVGKVADLDWSFKTPGTTLAWSEHPYVVANDLGVTFAENDIPRTVKTNANITAKAALYNGGPYTWTKGNWKIGYEWLYLDGAPAVKEASAGSLTTDVDPDAETATTVTIVAPSYPGKYQLVIDLHNPEGISSLDEKVTRGTAVLPMIVSVEGDKSAKAEAVDLNKYFTISGVGFQADSGDADFDGNGDCLPGAYMPPDGTIELDVNPLLVGKAGPPEYPSGYYSSDIGSYAKSNHRIAFLFRPKDEKNVIACNGQQIDLPAGDWSAIHVLASSTGQSASVTAQFNVLYKDGVVPKTVDIANWTKLPDPAQGTVALRLPYKLTKGVIGDGGPVFLGDYSISLDPTRRLQSITLPTDRSVKILAITLEK